MTGWVPRVADFGLARRLDQAGHTFSGMIVGTPSYMAPEQARGSKEVRPAADVYALGAILYECLTGRPPFRAADVFDTLAQVVSEEPAPPRQLNARVPRELETICLKCLAKEAGGRYASAATLADDLRRFLAGEPIQARPVGVAERAWKWTRRRPAVAGMFAGMVVLTVAALAIITALYGEASRHARVAESEAHQAQEQRDIAEANLELAKKAVDECFNVASKDALFQRPQMEKARKLLLEKTLPFYKNFRAQRPDDRRLKEEEATQWRRVAYIERILGRTREARESSEQARELFVQLVQAHPDLPAYQQELALSCNNVGVLLKELGKRRRR